MSAVTLRRSGTSQHVTGTALVFVSTIAWSFSGLYTRLLTTDAVTAIAWRSFFGGLFLVAPFILINGKGAFRALFVGGWPGVALIVAEVVCQASTVGALYNTSIANNAVIYATAPFMAAGLAFWLIGERMKPRTMLASAVALMGVVIIVSSAFGQGHVFGDLLAVTMTATFALIIVVVRAYPEAKMMPATILSGAVTWAIFAPFGHASATASTDWLVLAAFGLTNFTVAMYLFLAGARRIAAAQAALIGTLDVVLAPFWVWIAFGERPSVATAVGGGMILAIVIWHTIREWTADRSGEVAALP